MWANLVAAVDRADPFYLEVRSGNDVVASLLALHRPPFDRLTTRMARSWYSSVVGLDGGTLDLSAGPIIHIVGYDVISVNLLLDWVSQFASSHRVSQITTSSNATAPLYALESPARDAFIERGYTADLWASLLVDLSPSREGIWDVLSPAARKAVRKCERLGATAVEIGTAEDFADRFARTYDACEARDGRPRQTGSFWTALWERTDRSIYRYFVAQDADGHPLATLGIYAFGGVATEIASSTTNRAYESGIPAQDLLHWHVLIAAKDAGARLFDLAGIAPRPSSDKEAGIRRFKEKWGGIYTEYVRYTKERSTRRSRILTALSRVARGRSS